MNSPDNPGESAELIPAPQQITFRGSQIARWAAVVAWMGLIFYLSAQSRLPNVMPTVGHHSRMSSGISPCMRCWACCCGGHCGEPGCAGRCFGRSP